VSQLPTTEIEVHLGSDEASIRVGTAFVNYRRGTVTTNFNYDASYLRREDAWEISPDLPIIERLAVTEGLPGAISDTAPDRWGRNLIAKRLHAQAKAQGRPDATITDVDYLLEVSDYTRQGALRYTVGRSQFLATGSEVPKLLELPLLLDAAELVSRDEVSEDSMAAVKILLDAGSGSLGGARPKASVRDGDRLLIAKFPHHSDEWDVMAWEKTALDLAEVCGIRTPKRRLISVTGRSVLLLERFDRVGESRCPFVSAMTLVKGKDGETRDYIEIAEALADLGSNVKSDLIELWRRIAFSIAINNSDDHLRNHGFLRIGSGWTLSPVFDVNPNPDATAPRSTSINFESDPSRTLEALFEAAPIFGLPASQASDIWSDVRAGVNGWRSVAKLNKISEREMRGFQTTFAAHGLT
jgi:serine/threonine-protein kinase HipA